MNVNFKNHLLKVTDSSACSEIEVIQSLWSGYGKISRFQLQGSTKDTVVVKHISLVQLSEHPRAWATDNSHKRKVKSYEVETRWYENWNHVCTDNCPTPEFLGSFSEGKDKWIVLEDLNVHFPIRKSQLEFSEVKVVLKWLANFHATFLKQEPTGL
jgi:hypothetical protein